MQRFKKALVESYVAVITLGWIFAQAILHLAYVFASPFAQWIARREYGNMTDRTTISTRFYLQDAVPDLIRCVALLLIGYLLLRWLYFKPTTQVEVPDER